MKAAYYYGAHDIRMEDVEIPELLPEEILVKVMACGVCGTDVHIFEGAKGAAETHPPVILGHEFSGIVERTGAMVRGIEPGDRICVDPNNACGTCYYCKRGQAHFCEEMVGYGTTADGAFSQYCKVHYKQAYKLHKNISFEEAAMTEPVSCCLHGIDKCNISPGDTVWIIGAGMIGLIMVQLAKLSGATTVLVSEPVAEKRKMAGHVGADILVDPQKEELKEVLKEREVKQIDKVIECAGMRYTMLEAIKYAGKGSTVMLFGLMGPDEEISVKPYEIFNNEIDVKASYINPYTQKKALDMIASGRLELKSLMAEVVGLKELREVLQNPNRRSRGKIIVNPWL